MPKKNDNIVGRSEGPVLNGGRQTAEQAAIVRQGGDGKSDAERNALFKTADHVAGDPAVGGSSGGHSDQLASKGRSENRKVAGGLSQSERSHRARHP